MSKPKAEAFSEEILLNFGWTSKHELANLASEYLATLEQVKRYVQVLEVISVGKKSKCDCVDVFANLARKVLKGEKDE